MFYNFQTQANSNLYNKQSKNCEPLNNGLRFPVVPTHFVSLQECALLGEPGAVRLKFSYFFQLQNAIIIIIIIILE